MGPSLVCVCVWGGGPRKWGSQHVHKPRLGEGETETMGGCAQPSLTRGPSHGLKSWLP